MKKLSFKSMFIVLTVLLLGVSNNIHAQFEQITVTYPVRVDVVNSLRSVQSFTIYSQNFLTIPVSYYPVCNETIQAAVMTHLGLTMPLESYMINIQLKNKQGKIKFKTASGRSNELTINYPSHGEAEIKIMIEPDGSISMEQYR